MSDKLMGLLNEGIAAELQVSIQYMWHHVMCYGINRESVGDIFKQIIQVAHDEGDVTTKKLFMDILSEEEEHHNTFRTLLEK